MILKYHVNRPTLLIFSRPILYIIMYEYSIAVSVKGQMLEQFEEYDAK